MGRLTVGLMADRGVPEKVVSDGTPITGSRARDQGHVLHIESFIVPRRQAVTVAELEQARDHCIGLDWKIQDIVLVPVSELPTEAGSSLNQHQSERNR